jgi:hypothetical protein
MGCANWEAKRPAHPKSLWAGGCGQFGGRGSRGSNVLKIPMVFLVPKYILKHIDWIVAKFKIIVKI